MSSAEAGASRGTSRSVVMITVALAMVSAMLFLIIVLLFSGLESRQRGLRTSVQENAVWAAFQMVRESSRLIEVLHIARADPSRQTFAEVTLRYDILYSRIPLLQEGHFAVSFDNAQSLSVAAMRAYESILALEEPLFAAMSNPDRADENLPQLIEKAGETRSLAEHLLLETDTQMNAARVAERDHTLNVYRQVIVGLVLLTVAVAALIVLMAAQIVQAAAAGRRLRELNDAATRATEAAMAASRSKSIFLATMSHEIRSPLNGIIGAADLMDDGTLHRRQTERLHIIRQSGRLLLDVINDVLDFSKLESGEIVLADGEVALSTLLQDLETIMRPRAEAAKLWLRFDGPDIRFRGDAAKVRQILINLVGNALKFTASGGVRVGWSVAGAATVRFEIQDTGIGIAPEDQTLLFKEFSQIDTGSQRSFGGTGLGLVICRRLAQAMGGEVGVDSTPGVGSLFWFELAADDLVIAGASHGGAPKAVMAVPKVLPRLSGRVLVVDDTPINLQVACGILERLGVEVTCADNGQLAVERALAEPFDVILMDMQMPVEDGPGATRRLRAAGYKGRIIALTANAFTSDRDICLQAGMDDFMSKPVSIDRLAAVLARWLPDEGARAATTDRTAAGAAPAPRAMVLDHAQRSSLADELGEEVLENLCAKFFREVDSLFLKLDTGALRPEHAAEWDAALHSLKGSALTLGLVGIGTTAQVLRTSPPRGSGVDLLRQAVHEAQAALSVPAQPQMSG